MRRQADQTPWLSVEKKVGISEQRIPDNKLARVTQSFQRRLDDDIEAVLNCACISNNLEAATELLALFEKWQERRQMAHSPERRINDDAIPARPMRSGVARGSGSLSSHRSEGILG